MTPRERWIAALEMGPVDRLPFWPKLDGSYARAQEAPFDAMETAAIHDWIGSDRHVGLGGCAREVRTATSFESRKTNGRCVDVFRVPGGELTRTRRFDEASQSWHPVEMPVRRASDVAILTEWYADTRYELDREALGRSLERRESEGEAAVTTAAIGTSPLMEWVEHLAGVENAHYLLADHASEVEALFEAMHASLIRKAEIVFEHCPADLFYMVENTSTTLISPAQFRAYCARPLRDCAELARVRGKRLALHMCGHLKAILPDLAELPVSAFEAFTSPPVGNTRLADGRAQCPEVCLIGGTNAALWTMPAGEIIAELERDLGELPHHRGVVVTSAGVMPPSATPAKIRAVRDWVAGYPAGM